MDSDLCALEAQLETAASLFPLPCSVSEFLLQGKNAVQTVLAERLELETELNRKKEAVAQSLALNQLKE